MGRKRFQAKVVTGRYTLPAALLIALVCRLAGLAVLPADAPAGGSTLWAEYVALPAGQLAYWGCFALQLLAGWLLIVLNNTFAIIRTRASFQTSVYLLLLTALCTGLYSPHAGDAAALLCVISFFFLFHSYRHPAPSGYVFGATAFLALGSLAVPQMLWLLPFYWIGAYLFQSLTWRSFFASLVGCALPYWFLLGHAVWHGQMELFTAPFADAVRFTPVFEGLDGRRAAGLAYLFVLFIVSIGRFAARGYEDRIRTQCYLRFFIWLAFCLFAFALLQPTLGDVLLPLIAVCVSILAGHLFVLSDSRVTNVFFIVALAATFVLFVFNLWTLS